MELVLQNELPAHAIYLAQDEVVVEAGKTLKIKAGTEEKFSVETPAGKSRTYRLMVVCEEVNV